MLSCADSGPLLPPFGDWDAPIGATWHRTIQVVGGAAGAWRWRLVQGPAGLQVAGTATVADVWWTPDVYALAPVKPSQPRSTGEKQPVQVEATDSQGAVATSSGTVRAVPPTAD